LKAWRRGDREMRRWGDREIGRIRVCRIFVSSFFVLTLLSGFEIPISRSVEL
jgi:hypothetical protein